MRVRCVIRPIRTSRSTSAEPMLPRPTMVAVISEFLRCPAVAGIERGRLIAQRTRRPIGPARLFVSLVAPLSARRAAHRECVFRYLFLAAGTKHRLRRAWERLDTSQFFRREVETGSAGENNLVAILQGACTQIHQIGRAH